MKTSELLKKFVEEIQWEHDLFMNPRQLVSNVELRRRMDLEKKYADKIDARIPVNGPITIRAANTAVDLLKDKCFCAQGVTMCPKHDKQPAFRENCPQCGAVLAYCPEGEYCTKEDCHYAA